MIVDGNPDCPNFSRVAHLAHGPLPFGLTCPGVIPDMELIKIYSLPLKIFQASVQSGENVIRRKDFGERALRMRGPDHVFWWNLTGDDHIVRVAERAGDQPFTVPVAISKRGIKEIDPGVSCHT